MCTKKETNVANRSMKVLLKDYPSAVYHGLLGVALTNKTLVVLENHKIIMRRDHRSLRQLKIIGGGGSGVEPAESCYVGKGMLTAAVMGNIFTAPSAQDILIAIRELAFENTEDILLIVKNYVGDKLNFKLAADRALSEKINVKMLLIGDSVSDKSSQHGRRGMAGCVLIYKIAGEMAEEGRTMEEVIAECKKILPDLGTVSVTFTPCVMQSCGTLSQIIKTDEMYIGVGIYGQFGTKIAKINGLANSVSLCLEDLQSYYTSEKELQHCEVVVLINNLGGLSKAEESIIVMEVCNYLQNFKVVIRHLYSGIYMSSLNTQGFSVTILKIESESTLRYLCAPTTAQAWFQITAEETIENELLPITITPNYDHEYVSKKRYEGMNFGPKLSEKAVKTLKQVVIFACEAMISSEKQINIINAEAGDGDAGTSLRKCAEAIKDAIMDDILETSSLGRFLIEMCEIFARMGGLTGAMYTVFFNSAAKEFQGVTEVTTKLISKAFKSGVESMREYGKAEIGDRTVLDALLPAAETFEKAIKNGKTLADALYLAAATCEYKSEETKNIKPLALRCLNIPKHFHYADAGAHAATIWLRAVTEAFSEDNSTSRPGSFLWKFLNTEEANYVLDPDLTRQDLMTFLEQKIGTAQNLLVILLIETVKFCRRNYENKPELVSVLVGTIYFTHLYFVSSRWRTPADVYFYFRESILCQSVENPPLCVEIFKPEEAKAALMFFYETYLRNLPLVRLYHLPHYKLQLKIK